MKFSPPRLSIMEGLQLFHRLRPGFNSRPYKLSVNSKEQGRQPPFNTPPPHTPPPHTPPYPIQPFSTSQTQTPSAQTHTHTHTRTMQTQTSVITTCSLSKICTSIITTHLHMHTHGQACSCGSDDEGHHHKVQKTSVTTLKYASLTTQKTQKNTICMQTTLVSCNMQTCRYRQRRMCT